MMSVLRVFAVLLALALVGVEATRSWGVDRAPALWIDDVLIGAALTTAAISMRTSAARAAALFAGAWGAALSATYGAFSSALFDPVTVEIGILDLLQTQIATGAVFGAALIGFGASVAAPIFSRKRVSPEFDDSAGASELWQAADEAAHRSDEALAVTAQAPPAMNGAPLSATEKATS